MCMFELSNKLFKLVYDTVLDYKAYVFSFINSSSKMCWQPKHGSNRTVDTEEKWY